MDELRRQELEALARRAAESYPYRPDLLDPVFEYYYPKLRRYAFSYVRDDEQAADIAQSAMLNLYRFLPGFRFESSLRSWLYQITLNEIRRETGRATRRDQRKERYAETLRLKQGGDSGAAPDENENLERRMAIMRVFDRMDPKEADILRLFYYDDFAIKEICEIIGVGESAAKMRLKRAREKFARIWNER